MLRPAALPNRLALNARFGYYYTHNGYFKAMISRRRTADHRRTGLSNALFGSTQQRVLALLFGQPGRGFLTSEVIALSRSGSGAVQRELARLLASGLVTIEVSGRQKTYRANPLSPIFEELCGIALKTFGLAEPLREALAPLADSIDAAFIYGSVAAQQDTVASDIDLLVVSDSLAYPDVYGALEDVTERIGRRVNPTLYSRTEFERKAASHGSFVDRVLTQPRIWIKGDGHALGLR
ncbi:MAG: transcriptional regulator [Gammaproteobacteria bacterium]